MNIEKLLKIEDGMVVKNYTVMCKILDEKVKTGEAKKCQIQEWQRFFSYHKEGHKFIIDEIFEEPKIKLDLRGSNGIMSNDIQPLILDLLANSHENTVILSCTKLLEALNIVNKNYAIGRRNIKMFSEKIGVEEEVIFDFYQYEHSKLKANLESALRTLQNKSLILWNKIMLVHEGHGKDKNGNSYTIRKATNDEVELILSLQKEALAELEITNLQDIYVSKNRTLKFNKLMSKKLIEHNTNLIKAYKVYEIIYTREHVLIALEEEIKRLIQEELNFKVLQSAYKSIKEKNKNALIIEKNYTLKCEEWGEQEKLHPKIILRTLEGYVKKSEEVCNNIIDKNKEIIFI